MPSTMFGTKATLASRPEARHGDKCNPTYVARIFDQVWAGCMYTLANFAESTPDGARKIAHPRLIITVEPSGLFIDQKADYVDSVEGQVWFTSQFNSNAYRDFIRNGIQEAADHWAQGDYKHHYRVTEAGVQVLNQRPTD